MEDEGGETACICVLIRITKAAINLLCSSQRTLLFARLLIHSKDSVQLYA
ncbi:hypothetical protein AMTR_s00002p00220120 [Amborella trichopoda]|uniref:Uncharacterized protein n=1 Tax=Amborella trichopoda TaxID=13333 RepID=W1P0M8_AMBTC|nr:hypothetical protein AMTR_s00002p00220120 [Amborella trichopoda]